jgi:hypothetical protein
MQDLTEIKKHLSDDSNNFDFIPTNAKKTHPLRGRYRILHGTFFSESEMRNNTDDI